MQSMYIMIVLVFCVNAGMAINVTVNQAEYQ